MNQYRVKAKLMLEKEFTVFSDNAGKVREIAKNVIMHTDLVEFTEKDVACVEAEIWKKKGEGEEKIHLSECKGEDPHESEEPLCEDE